MSIHASHIITSVKTCIPHHYLCRSSFHAPPARADCAVPVQVVLKPDPGNAQELYLGSLQALGISTRDQDVRFVEDDWKSPALGANGLGWEVWLNGQVRKG